MGFSEQSIEEFVSVLASKAPVPGGGGASALVGAVGAALGSMVGALTLGKKRYADVEADMLRLQNDADALQKELLELIQKDAEAFEPLSRAYGLPAETPGQKAEKTIIMEAALKKACTAPLEIMRKCAAMIKLHEEYAAKGSRLAISDAGTGVIFCKAALYGASLNVYINTAAMTDRGYAQGINQETDALLAEYGPLADRIFAGVLTELANNE